MSELLDVAIWVIIGMIFWPTGYAGLFILRNLVRRRPVFQALTRAKFGRWVLEGTLWGVLVGVVFLFLD